MRRLSVQLHGYKPMSTNSFINQAMLDLCEQKFHPAANIYSQEDHYKPIFNTHSNYILASQLLGTFSLPRPLPVAHAQSPSCFYLAGKLSSAVFSFQLAACGSASRQRLGQKVIWPLSVLRFKQPNKTRTKCSLAMREQALGLSLNTYWVRCRCFNMCIFACLPSFLFHTLYALTPCKWVYKTTQFGKSNQPLIRKFSITAE